MGKDGDGDSCVSIIDLSLVPTEITHLGRLSFQELFLNHCNVIDDYITNLYLRYLLLKTHTFIKRYREDSENQDVAAVCCQVFEKLHEKAGNLVSVWLFLRNDHQNYHLQFYLNVILFFCIELAMTRSGASS